MTTVLPGVPLVLPAPPASPTRESWPEAAVALPPQVPPQREAEPPTVRAAEPAVPAPGPTQTTPAVEPQPPLEEPDPDGPAEPPVTDAEAEGSPRGRGAARGAGEVLLTVAALLGVVVLALTAFAAVTGLKPLVVRSGSMEPMIPTGAMVLVRTIPADRIEVGAVVAVDRPDNTRVMHRVVSVQHRGATAEVVLKGDANEDPDPTPIVVEEAGELVYSTPVVGRVSAFLASAKGGFVLGSLLTGVLMTVLRRRA